MSFEPPTSIRPRAALALLAIILCGATALRLHHLGTESLWLDEAFSITIGRSSLANIVFQTSRDVHPPLYYRPALLDAACQ